MDINYAKSCYAHADQEHTKWLGLYKECYAFGMPNRDLFSMYNSFPSTISGSIKDGSEVGNFDSTASLCVESFVAKTLVSLIPSGNDWFNLSVTDSDGPTLKVLEDATKILFKSIRSSNYYFVMGEAFADIIAGTMCVSLKYSGDKSNPLFFEAVPLPYIKPFENSKNLLTNQFRVINNIINQDLERVYKKANFKKLKGKIKEDPCGFTQLLECWMDLENGSWEFMLCDATFENVFLNEIRFYNPYTIGRWSRLSGESYGRGPLVTILPDLRELNYLLRLQTKANEICALSPQVMTTGGDINQYNISTDPGAINMLKLSLGQEAPTMTPIFRPQPMQGVIGRIACLMQNIKRGLFDDPIANQSEPGTTATEIRLRAQWYQQLVGAPAARIESEFLTPQIRNMMLIHTTYNIDGMRDLLKDIPQNSIEFQSPLVSNQRQEDIESMSEKGQVVGQLLGPQGAGAVIDPQKVVIEVNRTIRGPDIFKDAAEIQQQQENNQKMALMSHLASLSPQLGQSPNQIPSGADPSGAPQ